MAPFGSRDMRTVYLLLMALVVAFYGYVAWTAFHPNYPSRAYRLYYVEHEIKGFPGPRYDLTYEIGEDAERRHYGRHPPRGNLYFVLEQDIPEGTLSFACRIAPSLHAQIGDEAVPVHVELMVNGHESPTHSFMLDNNIDHTEMPFPAKHLERGLNELRITSVEIQLPHGRKPIVDGMIPTRLNHVEKTKIDGTRTGQ